jgi:hypothetical protein
MSLTALESLKQGVAIVVECIPGKNAAVLCGGGHAATLEGTCFVRPGHKVKDVECHAQRVELPCIGMQQVHCVLLQCLDIHLPNLPR